MNELTNNLDEQQAIARKLQQDLARIRKTYKHSLSNVSLFSVSGIAQSVAHSVGTETTGEQRIKDFKQKLRLNQETTLQELLQLCYDTLLSTSKDFASGILVILEGTFGINSNDYASYLEKNPKPEYVVNLPPKKSTSKNETTDKAASSSIKSDSTTPSTPAAPKIRYESALTRYTDLLTQKPDIAIQFKKEAMRHFIMQDLFKRIVLSGTPIDATSFSQSPAANSDTIPQRSRKK